MRSFAPLVLVALATSASAQSLAAPVPPTDLPSGRPSGIRTGSAPFPQGTGGFGGPQVSGERPTGAFHSGFPSDGFGGAFATASNRPHPSGVNAPFESGFEGRPSGRPSAVRPSGSHVPPALPGIPTDIIARQAPTGFESGFEGTKPTAGFPTAGFPPAGLPTDGAFPSGGLPSGGFPSGGFPSGGFPSGGFPTDGFPTDGFPTGGFPSTFRTRVRPTPSA
ncbi:hypothetical protein ONS95_010062 [Cadophora gregata]|uniref:uncharacterized protein n=1 Tax=Cadophora gregata TaxID=51156 RepID=UPI0026DBBEC6|nr:uncharacterized protein ONS95_010062 [Cadophora gregata]KAK0121779.1 hypothetical protein ONS95_010062 [Cadophora gregata]KAK0127254.1 hypothetical protein ONS96_006805 [Cadophora gregata f. sp. sojae]